MSASSMRMATSCSPSSVELTDEFEAGAMEDLLLALREGGRLAARSGSRDEDGTLLLTDAAYSACAVRDAGGCAKDAQLADNGGPGDL